MLVAGRPKVWQCLVIGWVLTCLPALAESRKERTERLRAELRAAEQAADDSDGSEADNRYRNVIDELEGSGQLDLLLARAVDGLADIERRRGRLPEAEQLYLRSSVLWEELLGPDQPRLAITLHNLGMLYVEQARDREAEEFLGRALEIWEARYGADSAQARNTRRAYSRVRLRSSRSGLADPLQAD